MTGAGRVERGVGRVYLEVRMESEGGEVERTGRYEAREGAERWSYATRVE